MEFSMDNRHKHIEKLINTMVVPKANKILMEDGAPLIINVEVDDVHPMGNQFGPVNISIMIHYKNQEGGRYVSISSISYPISCMIVTIIPYVIVGDYRITIINILKDNLDSSTFRFNNFDPINSFKAYLNLLKDRT
jgi:hypothetical protein